MSKSVMIIDTPSDCCECPFGTMAFGKSICFLDEGNGIDCPLKPYKDSIPIEWVPKKMISEMVIGNRYAEGCVKGWNDCIDAILSKLEKENEQV